MWRSALVVLLLAGSPALAGQASTAIQVGITITGTTAQSPARAKARQQTVAGSPGGTTKQSMRQRSRLPK